MQVAEIKAKSPLAEVVELNPDARYLILIQQKSEDGKVEGRDADMIYELLRAMGIESVALITRDLLDMRFFEFQEGEPSTNFTRPEKQPLDQKKIAAFGATRQSFTDYTQEHLSNAMDIVSKVTSFDGELPGVEPKKEPSTP